MSKAHRSSPTGKVRKVRDGHLQDFVHEATQIDKLTNSEQNRHLQTINSKKIKLQRVTIIIISIQNKSKPKFYQRTYHQSGDDS